MNGQLPRRAAVPLRVGIAGLGAIGAGIAREIARGAPGLVLAAVSSLNIGRAAGILAAIEVPVPVVPLGELPTHADVVVECLPAAAFDEITEATLRAGKGLAVLSAGNLIRRADLVDAFRERRQTLLVPTGAIMGLDVVRALARGSVTACRIITRKSPASLRGAPYIAEQGIDLDSIREPVLVFSGSSSDAVRGFPANVNVAVSLSLAGIGPDRTQCDIWVDPGEAANVHIIEIEADSASVRMTISGRPDPSNPRTSEMTALSAVDALIRLVDPIRIGS